jgi:lambda family phage portal protein
MFAPVLTTVEMIDGLTEAELVASRHHASKMGFLTNLTPEAIDAYATRLRLATQQGKDIPSQRLKVAPGMIHELQPGQGFEAFDPTHPNDAFDPFLKTMLRGVSRGFGMSYLTLTGDVGEANYSSMRAGLLPERDHWRVLQNVLASRVHRHVYRDWLAMAQLTGQVRASGLDPNAVEWRARRWQWVDPRNDLEAAEREVKLGVNSRQRLAADRGLDFEVVVDETAEDLAYARENGVYVGGVDTPPKPRTSEPATDNGTSNGKPKSRLAPFGVTP